MILRCLVGAVIGGVFWLAIGLLLAGGLGSLLPGSIPLPPFWPTVILYAGSWLLFGAASGAYAIYLNFPPDP